MSEQNSNQQPTPEVAPEVDVVVEPNRLQKFVINHPRASKVVAIVGGTTAVIGTAVMTNTLRKNRHHLNSAAGEAKEALHELSEAVSPSPEND